MPFTLIYEPGSGTVQPVVIHSLIRWNAEPVMLNPDFNVVVAPGCPWGDRIDVTDKEIIDAGKAVRFTVMLKGKLSVPDYESLIMRKEPIRLAVTLSPLDLPIPTIGVPVSTGQGPMTNFVVIGAPDFPPATIETTPEQVPDTSDGSPTTALTARLRFSGPLAPTDSDIAAVQQEDWFSVVSEQEKVKKVRENAAGKGKHALFRANGLKPGTAGVDSFDVRVAVMIGSRTVEEHVKLTLVPRKNYILRVSTEHLSVTKSSPGTFHASVNEETGPGKEVPVPGAVISIAGGEDSAGKLRVSTTEGSGRVDCTVTQIGGGSEESAALHVTARVGRETFSTEVNVTLGEAPSVVLVTAFDSRGGAAIDPLDKSTFVVIDARLDPQPGAALTERERTAVINFEEEPVDGLAISCVPFDIQGDWWSSVEVRAERTSGNDSSHLPDEIIIEVLARSGSDEIARCPVRVPLGVPAVLTISPEEVDLLAHPETRRGKAPAPAHVEVSLAVSSLSDRAWTYELTSDDDAWDLVTIEGPKDGDGGAVFKVSVSPNAAPVDPPMGPGIWERKVLLHPKATSGDRVLKGDDLPVVVSFEGLFIAGVYTWQRGDWKTSGKETTVPLRTDLPTKDPRRVAFVRFVAKTWNGTGVDDDRKMVAEITFERPESDSAPAQVLFSLGDLMRPAMNTDPNSHLEGTWKFEFKRFVPGSGEKYPAGITARSAAGDCAVPLELIIARQRKPTGNLTEEQDLLLQLINDCIPHDRQEYTDLTHDLAEFGKKHAGASDYATLRKEIWEDAQKIWQEDRQDYLTWKPWEKTILTGLGATKKVGDFAFMAVVGFYTRNLGFMTSFGTQQFGPLIKDELIAFFNFYTDAYGRGQDDIGAVWWQYYAENKFKWIEGLGVAGADTVIMKNFDPKNPSVKILVAMFVWKFTFHKARPKEDGTVCGYVDAFEAASWDMVHLTFAMLFQEFVNASGDKTLSEVWESAKASQGAGSAPKPLTTFEADLLWNRLRLGLKDGYVRKEDVLEMMRHPEQVRQLDKLGESELRAAFDRTRSEIYERHDAQLVESLKQNHPEYAGKEIRVVEFGTPGAKPGEKLNTDRDYRVVEVIGKDASGHDILREVPRTKWEQSSYEIFARETGCPNWKNPEAAQQWAAERQQLGTDAIHEEACMDFKDQGHIRWDETSQSYVRTIEPSMQSNVTRVSAGHGKLNDPPGIGQMYRTKVGDAYSTFGEPEAFVQASKGMKMLDTVRNGYSKNYDIPELPKNFQEAANAVHDAAKHPWEPAAIEKANRAIQEQGFSDINSFTEMMAKSWEGLTLATPKTGTGGG